MAGRTVNPAQVLGGSILWWRKSTAPMPMAIQSRPGVMHFSSSALRLYQSSVGSSERI